MKKFLFLLAIVLVILGGITYLAVSKSGSVPFLSPFFEIGSLQHTVTVDIPVKESDKTISVKVPTAFTVDRMSDGGDVVLEKFGDDGYRIEIDVRPKPRNTSLEEWIFTEAFRFIEPGTPSTFAEYKRAQVESIEVAELSGFRVTTTSLQTSRAIFLDDPAEEQVIWFRIYGLDWAQDLNLYNNLDEAYGIVESLQH